MTGDAQFKGMSTPSHYNQIDIEKIKERAQKVSFIKPINEGPLTDRIGKIPKNDIPGCCSYQENDAFYKTAIDSPIKWPLSKAKRITYTA